MTDSPPSTPTRAALPGQASIDPLLIARTREAAAMLASDPAAARAASETIVASVPDFAPARRIAALAARRLGDGAAADRLELEAIAVALTHPLLVEAQAALAASEHERAERLVRANLRADPEDPASALILGEIARACKARPQAENLFRRAFTLAPAYAEARMALAHSQREAGRYDEALNTLAGLFDREPFHQNGLALEAAIHVQLRDFAEACFNRLIAAWPDDPRGWMNCAFMLKTIGRREQAIAAYRRALALDPGHAQAWWGLANLKTVRLDEADVAAMRAALGAQIDEEDRIHLLYALGKALDGLDQPAEAFAAFAQGAKLRLARVPYDPAKVEANVERVERVFTPAFFASRAGQGAAAADPIFIVSLPRSGSTLVEQILASHPLVEGTEELFDIERIALELAPGEPAGSYADRIGAITPAKLRELGEHYLDATRRVRLTDRPLFTDKMPSNWVYIGLIAAILPNAKIIDVRRHPMGCGFANFSQHFNWGINFSYDLKHIGRFYSAYVRQMAHFDRALPGRVHHLTYEALVENTEVEVRRLLAACGLPFDPACLRFFENRRAVHTPSSEQVREPINRAGMERWQRYDVWLEPLRRELGPVLEHYPEVPPALRPRA